MSTEPEPELPTVEGMEEALLQHVKLTAPAGDPDKVLSTIDEYCWTSKSFFMNVGDVKGKIVDEAILAKNPVSVLELGAYCGYSAVRIGRLLKGASGAKLFSVELDAKHVAIAQEMADYAGLHEQVKVLKGTLADVIPDLKNSGAAPFDFVFIDHEKTVYLKDLLLMLENKLLAKGCVVVADNVKFPGAPDYLAYIESSKEFVTKKVSTKLEYHKNFEDWVTISTFEG